MNTGLLKKIAVWVGIALAIAAAGPLLLSLLGHWLGERVAGSLIGSVKQAVGLNPWQEAFWLVVLTAIAAIAVRLLISWKESRITAGMAILTALFATTYGYLWHQTRDDWFTTKGEPLKCYALHGKTIKVRDMVAFDPDTGAPCKPVSTRELATKLQAWLRLSGTAQAFAPIVTRPSQYFSIFVQGEAVLWYFRRPDGKIELYDMPGYHPIYSDELLPVTRGIVEEVERAFQAIEMASTARKSTPERREARPPTPTTSTSSPPETRLSRYVDIASVPTNATAVAYRGDDEMARQFIARMPQPISLLSKGSPFHAEGLFDRALLGDATQLRQIGFGKAFRRMFLLNIAAPQSTVHRELEGLTRCEIKVQITEIDPAGGALLKSTEAVFEGKGFTVAAAMAAARADAGQRIPSLLQR